MFRKWWHCEKSRGYCLEFDMSGMLGGAGDGLPNWLGKIGEKVP